MFVSEVSAKERMKMTSPGAETFFCNICCKARAKDLKSDFFKQNVKSLLKKCFKAISLDSNVKKSVKEFFDTDRISGKCYSNHPNVSVLKFIKQMVINNSLSDNVPLKYDSIPRVINFYSHKEKGSVSNVSIKHICSHCKSILRNFARLSRMCRALSKKLVLKVIKSAALHAKETGRCDAEVEQTEADSSALEHPFDVKYSLHDSIEEISAPQVSKPTSLGVVKRKRGRPRKDRAMHRKRTRIENFADADKNLCPFCNKIYSVKKHLEHKCLPFRNTLFCKECKTFSTSSAQFETHLKVSHNNTEKYVCNLDGCHEKFVTEVAKIWHSESHKVRKFDKKLRTQISAKSDNCNEANISEFIGNSIRLEKDIEFTRDENDSLVVGDFKEKSTAESDDCQKSLLVQSKSTLMSHSSLPLEESTLSSNAHHSSSHSFTMSANHEANSSLMQSRNTVEYLQKPVSSLQEVSLKSSVAPVYTLPCSRNSLPDGVECQCPMCDCLFSSVENFAKHLSDHNPEESCKCILCSCVMSISDLQSHILKAPCRDDLSSIGGSVSSPVDSKTFSGYVNPSNIQCDHKNKMEKNSSFPLKAFTLKSSEQHLIRQFSECQHSTSQNKNFSPVNVNRCNFLTNSNEQKSLSFSSFTEFNPLLPVPHLVGSEIPNASIPESVDNLNTESPNIVSGASPSIDLSLKCQLCSKYFSNQVLLLNHLSTCHPIVDHDQFLPSSLESIPFVRALESSVTSAHLAQIEELPSSLEDIDYF